ncbi:hypothetical protein ACKVMT_02825 [Halobacteriales archaeon Cl-PHB]
MSESICGESTQDGEPCQRQAGWGLDAEIGPCKEHTTDYRVPEKLTPTVTDRLVEAAGGGAKLKHCAWFAGIARSTLWDWLSRGESHREEDIDSALADLHRTFQRARAADAVERLRDANDEFVLERSFGYTKQQEVAVDSDHDMDPEEAADAYLTFLDAVETEAEPGGDGGR